MLARSVEKDNRGGAVGVHFLESRVRVAHFRNFDGRLMADSFYVVFDDGAHFGAAGFAEHEQANLHFRLVFLALFEQGLAADAQNFGSAANLVVRGFQRCGDRFLLNLFQRTEVRRGTG